MTKTTIERIKQAKEIAVRVTRLHVLPTTVSDMAVMQELTGWSTWPADEVDTVLAKLSEHGFALRYIA